MATMHRTTEVIIKAKIQPTLEDLLTTLRTACDPRSCLFNLSTLRALRKQLKGEITKVWVDGGHTCFTWQGKKGRYRWSADTPRWVKNVLHALDKWDTIDREKGKPCPIRDLDATWGPPDKSNGPAGLASGEACEKVDLLRGTINKAKGTPPRRRGQAGDGRRL
jgi:hypothetical protein